MKTLRCAVIGLEHDHIWWYLEKAAAIDGFEIVALADDHDRDIVRFKSLPGMQSAAVYGDWRRLLDEVRPDLCLCYANNQAHLAIAESCAQRGVHLMIEKPMAASLQDAVKMQDLARQGGVTLMVNYPFAFNPPVTGCRELLARGALGRPLGMRWRGGHMGPKRAGCSDRFAHWLCDNEKNGGGAEMDFGIYGAILFAWYFGLPQSVSAQLYDHGKTGQCDHAIITLSYQSGICGTIEATWSQPGGTEHLIYCENGAVFSDPSDNRQYWIREGSKTEPAQFDGLYGGRHGSVPYFVSCLRGERTPQGIFAPETSVQAHRIIDAAERSFALGRACEL